MNINITLIIYIFCLIYFIVVICTSSHNNNKIEKYKQLNNFIEYKNVNENMGMDMGMDMGIFESNNYFINQTKCKKKPKKKKKMMGVQKKLDMVKKIKNKVYVKKWYNYKNMLYRKILRKTIEALDELNIKVFLSSGTLLGYFRHSDFMDHDYDVDLGIMADDYDERIPEVMEKHGLKMYRTLGTVEKGYEMSFRMKNKIMGKLAKVDIFLHYPEIVDNEKKIFWTSYKNDNRIKYRVSDFDLKLVEFGGSSVYVPSDTEKYIVEHYGEDWYIEKKAYGKDRQYFYYSTPTSIVK